MRAAKTILLNMVKDYVENYDQFNMQKNKNGNAKKVEEILDAILNKVGGIHIKLSERTCS